MYLEGKVERRTSCWHCLDFSLRGKYEDFRSVEVQLDGIEEVHGVWLWIVQNFLDGAQPVVQFILVLGIFATFLVFPVSGKAFFCHLVHAVASDLYLYPSTQFTHQGNVESLVAVCLRVVEPVAETVRMTLVYLADGNIDIEAFVHLVGSVLWCHDDANRKNIVDFIEGYVFVLHFVPDGIRTLYACLDLVFYTQLVKFFTDRTGKIIEENISLSFSISQFMLNVGIFLWMVVSEAEIFQFGFYLVQS